MGASLLLCYNLNQAGSCRPDFAVCLASVASHPTPTNICYPSATAPGPQRYQQCTTACVSKFASIIKQLQCSQVSVQAQSISSEGLAVSLCNAAAAACCHQSDPRADTHPAVRHRPTTSGMPPEGTPITTPPGGGSPLLTGIHLDPFQKNPGAAPASSSPCPPPAAGLGLGFGLGLGLGLGDADCGLGLGLGLGEAVAFCGAVLELGSRSCRGACPHKEAGVSAADRRDKASPLTQARNHLPG